MIILELTDREALLMFSSLQASLANDLSMSRKQRQEAVGVMDRFYETHQERLTDLALEMAQEMHGEF